MKIKNRQISALLRPFNIGRSEVVSKNNKIVGAFIYDSDNRISLNNHLITAQFSPTKKIDKDEE